MLLRLTCEIGTYLLVLGPAMLDSSPNILLRNPDLAGFGSRFASGSEGSESVSVPTTLVYTILIRCNVQTINMIIYYFLPRNKAVDPDPVFYDAKVWIRSENSNKFFWVGDRIRIQVRTNLNPDPPSILIFLFSYML